MSGRCRSSSSLTRGRDAVPQVPAGLAHYAARMLLPDHDARQAQAPIPSAGEGELFIIANTGSGEHDGVETRELLAGIFREAGRPFRFVPVDRPQALAAACERAAADAAGCGGVLVAAGGDGTINAVAGAAWRKGCRLGVLPMGTFNYFARNHGIPQDLEAAARALLLARAQPVQVGEVNGQLFLVNASLGLYPQLLQDREAFKQRFGRRRWVAIVSGLMTIFAWRRQLVLELEADGKRTVITTPTLVVGNNRLQLERIGMGKDVLHNLGSGELAAVLARPIGSWQMIGLLMRGALGRLGDADQVHSFAFSTMTVRVAGRRKIKFAADGEVRVLTPPLRFAVGASPLQLMMPRDEDRVAVE